MRFCVIGDIHGRDSWIDLIEKNEDCHFVFLGDYCDPYDDNIDDNDSLVNLNLIINYKKSHPDNVTLIIGNHDVQYIYYPHYKTSERDRNEKLKETVKVFQENKDLFQFAYQKENHLFVHAGVSVYWYDEFLRLLDIFGLKDKSNLADVLNNMGNDEIGRETLMMTSFWRGGKNSIGGPLWADMRELEIPLEGIHQYTGHNKVQNIWTKGDKTSSITFCDILSTRKKSRVKSAPTTRFNFSALL